MSVQSQIAEAIRALIEGATFTHKLTPEWSYPTKAIELKELDKVRVDVIPSGFTSEHGTRGSMTRQYRTVVVIRKRFEETELDESKQRAISSVAIAEAESLVEEIDKYLASPTRWRLTDDDGLSASWIRAEVQSYDMDQLTKNATFEGKVILTHETEEDFE